MNAKKVIKICGDYPTDFIKLDIESNPNFIFINDPNYGPVRVWDADANFIFVNSFIECEHYVLGGWDKNPVQNQEAFSQNLLLASVVLVLIGSILFKRFFGNIKNA